MPESALDWSEGRLRLALLHEFAHITRRDLWTGLIVAAAKAAYWFHPLVWWVSSKATEQQELACDDRVLSAGAQVEEYAALLVDTAHDLTSIPLFGCPMVGNAHALRGRIMHILQFRSESRAPHFGRSPTFIFSALLLAAALSVPAAVDHPANTNTEPVYKVGGNISPPTVISKIQPEYVESAWKKNRGLGSPVFIDRQRRSAS